jgi:hypothetical protein
MNRGQILTMDPYILLSWTNTKLRDQFSDIFALCEDYDVEYEDITLRLKSVGYSYNKDINQFIYV